MAAIKEKSITKDKVIISWFYRFTQETKSTLESILLLFFVLNSKSQNNELTTLFQQTKMAQKLSVSRQAIANHIKHLKKLGLIDGKAVFADTDHEDEITYIERYTKITLSRKLESILFDEIRQIMK